MIQQLIKLSNYLYESGHNKESDFLDSIIKSAEEDAEVEMEEPETNEDGNRTVYNLNINDLNYEVIFRQKTYNSPFDISFKVKGVDGYPMTGRGEVFALLNAVIDVVKDFIRRFPDVDSFSFTGAEESVAEGAMDATKRTRVYNKFIERYLRRDPELKDKFRIGDLAWAGQPNMVSIRKLSHFEPKSNREAKRLNRIGRLIIKALRHKPEELNITLDRQGWIQVSTLLDALEKKDKEITREQLEYLVTTSDKQRFAFDESGEKIRANQGHSVDVDLGYEPQTPPEYLYHGTNREAVADILESGVKRMERHHVHLSDDLETAIKVGRRRGKLIILRVDSGKMHEDGYTFRLSDNNVWLTDYIPIQYISTQPHTTNDRRS